MVWGRASLLALFLLSFTGALCSARTERKWRPANYRSTSLPDFRFNSARIEGITRLFNGSLIVVSNGYYWVLAKGELPRARNVKGPTSELYPNFANINAIWTDPYNEIGQQIYLASNTPTHGLRVVCQEFSEPFNNHSAFCHLPVNAKWKNALKDLQFDKPIDAVTWRNRTKDKDGGFWVFFQGSKMITIDPYEMRLRFTYDIKKWMNISERITAAIYDYKQSVYHLFFDNPYDQYRTWTVNVSFMNSLPMSWDRAFLHGTLSPPMRINRHFFGFPDREIHNRPQPYYEKFAPVEEISDNRLDTRNHDQVRTPHRADLTTEDTVSDVLYIKPREQIVQHNEVRNGKLQTADTEAPEGDSKNGLSKDDDTDEQISYQKQLMQFNQEGVLDFAPDRAINAAVGSFSAALLVPFLCFSLLGAALMPRLYAH